MEALVPIYNSENPAEIDLNDEIGCRLHCEQK